MNYKELLVPLTFVLITFGCKEKKYEFSNIVGSAQGTTYSIVIEKRPEYKVEDLQNQVEKIFRNFDLSLSLYNDSSVISRVNRNEDIIVDTFFMEVFKRSMEISEMTRGAFDITVGPLVRAWGFGPDAHKSFDRSKLDSLRKLVGYKKITLRNNRLIKSDPAICLDVNAIAQGFSVDILARYFDQLGMKNYLIEVGGEVRVRGNKGGENWKIGIDKPEDNNMTPGDNLQAIIMIKDKSIATSGNYRKFYMEDGIKYSHTIDPATGFPAMNRLLSATIIAADCATADGIATACMVMGKEKAIDFLQEHPEFEALLVYSDDEGYFKTWITENLKSMINETPSR